jgi:hypothetical protein
MIPRSRPTGKRLEIVGRARSQPREGIGTGGIRADDYI